MEYITAEEYIQLTGCDVPEDFGILSMQASGIIDRETNYKLSGVDSASIPDFIAKQVKKAAAAEVMYLDDVGGLQNANSNIQSATLGKFSYTVSAASDGIMSDIGPGVLDYLRPTGLLYRGAVVL